MNLEPGNLILEAGGKRPSNQQLATSNQRGYVLLLTLVFMGIFATVATALVGSVISYGKVERSRVASAQALAIAEGALDLAVERLNDDPFYGGTAETSLGEGTFTIEVATIDQETRRVTATGYVPSSGERRAMKTVRANVGIVDSRISFHYGIQSGNGGFEMRNNSIVSGNIFSNGRVAGDGTNNMVYGDIISAGANGLVYGVHATGTVRAHSIGNASANTIIDTDAHYYETKVNTTVAGTSFPGSADQTSAPLPISDAQIASWEAQAAAGGVASCSGGQYTISSGAISLGPVKIPCDLVISNSAVVTVRGHIWVAGNISVQNSAKVKMDPSLGSKNVAIIADNPANRLTSSIITVRNTATFENSGTPGSFVFLISQNNSAELGGAVVAFELGNSASALVAYAAHGLIPLANSVSLREVTGYKITLANSASIVYDTGLPSSVFESGPGGSWSFVPGTYAITR